MKKSCEDIEKVLVDYSDGLLSHEEKSHVSQHLEKCENCRKLLEALERSLELSSIIWEDNLTDIEKVKIRALPKVKKTHWLRYASIAASILIAMTAGILWCSFHRQGEKQTELTFEEIEKNINDSANAARLLAATELLADYSDYKDVVESQYRYIAQTYPGTPAAEKIKLKHPIN
ncbi:MAG: zf-HC2 domain-containing protein [Sedimentisphaerales bacterium]|jgi:anti-sigma factor RsiW